MSSPKEGPFFQLNYILLSGHSEHLIIHCICYAFCDIAYLAKTASSCQHSGRQFFIFKNYSQKLQPERHQEQWNRQHWGGRGGLIGDHAH